jgi:ABC-type sugar transport system ATPase subunit
LRDLTFDLRRGEIVGVTGLLGCGRSELARMIAGAQHRDSGDVVVDGRALRSGDVSQAIAAGVALVPQDRRGQGCVLPMTVRENLTLPDVKRFWRRGLLRRRAERNETRAAIKAFDIRPSETERPVEQLSGGNQQKVVLSRWARLTPRVLVLDEPTQGVDVGAKEEIAAIIRRLATDGVSILLASSDFDELVPLCDRVLVLNRGRLAADVGRDHLSTEHITLISTNPEGSSRDLV